MINNINQYSKIENYQGRGFANLPYDLRVELYQKLLPEEYKKFERGFANEDIIEKAQSIMESWYDDTFPTDAMRLERVIEARAKDKILNIKRQLEYAQAKLSHWDEVLKNDGIVPYGERNRLKAEIDQLKRELEVTEMSSGVKADDVENPEDWMNSLFD